MYCMSTLASYLHDDLCQIIQASSRAPIRTRYDLNDNMNLVFLG